MGPFSFFVAKARESYFPLSIIVFKIVAHQQKHIKLFFEVPGKVPEASDCLDSKEMAGFFGNLFLRFKSYPDATKRRRGKGGCRCPGKERCMHLQ